MRGQTSKKLASSVVSSKVNLFLTYEVSQKVLVLVKWPEIVNPTTFLDRALVKLSKNVYVRSLWIFSHGVEHSELKKKTGGNLKFSKGLYWCLKQL